MTVEVGRETPYERAFGDPRFEEREFPAILEEAETRGLEPGDRDQFSLIGRTGLVLRELVPEGTPSGALDTYLATLFHAFHFWRAGREMYAFEAEVVRELVEVPPALEGWDPELPAAALYLELPRQLFWAAVAEEGVPPEPVEGIFLRARPDPDRVRRLQALMVLGMRPGRAGFSAVGIDAAPGDADTGIGPDAFRSDLPGAELAELYGLREREEVVVLTLRLLWYLAEHRSAVRLVEGGTGTGSADDTKDGGGTVLRYHRVGGTERTR